MKRIIYLLLAIFLFSSCNPKLTYIEAEDLINNFNTSLSERDIKYQINQAPVRTIKSTYGNKKKALEYHKKRLSEFKNDTAKQYNDISILSFSDKKKCFGVFFYIVDYSYSSGQFAPYFDEDARKFVEEKYGKENYSFHTDTKILQITKNDRKVIIYDIDRKWKTISYVYENIESGFGEKIADCIINQ